jgi:hypothetical protein
MLKLKNWHFIDEKGFDLKNIFIVFECANFIKREIIYGIWWEYPCINGNFKNCFWQLKN